MMYSLLSFHVLAGDGRSLDTVLLIAAHRPTTSTTPTMERAKLSKTFFMSFLPLQTMNCETRCVFFGVLWIEHAVGQPGRGKVRCGDLHAEFFHRRQIEVRAHNLFGHLLVIRRAFDHAPSPELAQPPVAVGPRREVAVALGENHVIRILLLAAVAVIVLAQQPIEDDFLWTVDVGRP